MRAWMWIALLAGCRTVDPTGTDGAGRAEDAGRERIAAAASSRRAAPTGFSAPVVGLHLLEAPDLDEPGRIRATRPVDPLSVARPVRPPTVEAASLATAGAVDSANAPATAAPLLDRAAADVESFPPPAGGNDSLWRFGRGIAEDRESLSNFSFLRMFDRYSTTLPDADDPLAITKDDAELEERARFFRTRAKGTVSARLRDGIEEVDFVGPVIVSTERLPQSGLDLIESVVDEVSGDDDGVDLGELRLRQRGGFHSPSRMISLRYEIGPVGADFYPAEAKLRIAKRFGAYRVSLRGDVDYADATPRGRIEVSRRVGREWRIRVAAGSGVGFFTIPVFTPWPGDTDSADERRGAIAFLERRF